MSIQKRKKNNYVGIINWVKIGNTDIPTGNIILFKKKI